MREVDFQLKQMLDILKLRLAKRGIDVMCVDPKDPVTNLAAATQEIVLRHGIDQENGKKVQQAHQGVEAEGAGEHPGRQGARDRQAARRPAGGHGAAAQIEARSAAAVQ